MKDVSYKKDHQGHQSSEDRALLRPAGRVLAGLAVLILDLVLAGGAYQSIAGAFILILALADEIYRVLIRRR